MDPIHCFFCVRVFSYFHKQAASRGSGPLTQCGLWWTITWTNQSCLIFNWTLLRKPQWCLNQDTVIFVQTLLWKRLGLRPFCQKYFKGIYYFSRDISRNVSSSVLHNDNNGIDSNMRARTKSHFIPCGYHPIHATLESYDEKTLDASYEYASCHAITSTQYYETYMIKCTQYCLLVYGFEYPIRNIMKHTTW